MQDPYLRHLQYSQATPIWSARLTTGETVFQDDGRPGMEPSSAWTRLKSRCREEGVGIVGIDLQFRSNVIRNAVPYNAPAYFFAKNACCVDTGQSFHFYLLGYFDWESEQFQMSRWRVPDLARFDEPSRDLDNIKTPCVIVNRHIMAKSPTENCKFESRYGGGFVTAPQFIAEMMCERIAKKDKKTLPDKPWATKEWGKVFMTQLRRATAIVNVFAAEAVLRALRSRKGSWIYSLGAEQALLPLFQEEQKKFERELTAMEAAQKAVAEQERQVGDKSPRPNFQAKPNLISRLNDLDGEEEDDTAAGD